LSPDLLLRDALGDPQAERCPEGSQLFLDGRQPRLVAEPPHPPLSVPPPGGPNARDGCRQEPISEESH
jgi:hypothetical protein